MADPFQKYTPDNIKRIIEDALSPTICSSPAAPDSPLAYKTSTTTRRPSSSSSSSSSSERETFKASRHETTPLLFHTPTGAPSQYLSPNFSDHSTPTPTQKTPYGGYSRATLPSIPSPTPLKNGKYEVETEFLKAMMVVLEREAMMAKERSCSREDIKEIVRGEIWRFWTRDDGGVGDYSDTTPSPSLVGPTSPITRRRKRLHQYISLRYIIDSTVGVLSWVVIKHFLVTEKHGFFRGTVLGSLLGLAGTVVLKGLLWGIDMTRGGSDGSKGGDNRQVAQDGMWKLDDGIESL